MRASGRRTRSGYTLVETLVASAVIMIAIGAASSLSLSMVTQEIIAEKTVRASNYLENVAMLYHLGMETGEIQALLPVEATVDSVTFTPKTVSVTDLGSVSAMDIQISYTPSGAVDDNAGNVISWTGGEKSVTRTHQVTAVRSEM